MLVNPNDPKDVAQVHALQDAVTVSQTSPGRFEIPNWDPFGAFGLQCDYGSRAYSARASLRTGMSGSAFFQSVKRSL